MCEKLSPQVGDKVQLENTNGGSAVVTVTASFEGVVSSRHYTFSETEGWEVVKILERPKPKAIPPVGTIIEGVDNNGDRIRGCTTSKGTIFVVSKGTIFAVWWSGNFWTGAAEITWDDLKSWEVVECSE